jgi:hypothetical protein
MRASTTLAGTGCALFLGLLGPSGGKPASAAPPSLPTGAVVKIARSATGFDIAMKYGGVPINCSAAADSQAGRWKVTCDHLTLAMTGTIDASSASLMSVDDVDFSTLGNGLPELVAAPIELIAAVAPFKTARLGITSSGGLYIHGTLELAKVADSNEIGKALGAISGFVQQYVSGGLKALSPAFDLYPSHVGGKNKVELRIPLVDTCVGPDSIGPLKSGIKFQSAWLTFGMSASKKPELSAKIDGAAYIKPTGRDAWIYFNPSAEFAVKDKATTVSIGGSITGACPADCAKTCSCDTTKCTADWHPFGLQPIAINGGNLTVGMSSLSPEVPIIDAGLTAKIGSVRGTAGLHIDTPGKKFGFYASADHLTLGDAVRTFASATPPKILDVLGIRSPSMSIALAADSKSVFVNGQSLPVGYALKGSIGDPSIGLVGAVDFSQGLPGKSALELLEALVSKSGPPSSITSLSDAPAPTLNLSLDARGLEERVLRKLPGTVREILGDTFMIENLALGVTLGASPGFSAKVSFKALGYPLTFDLNARTDDNAIIEAIKGQLESLAGKVAQYVAQQAEAWAKSAWNEFTHLVSECATIHTVNSTGKKVWVTIYYKAFDKITDSGWVEPHSHRAWHSSSHLCGSAYEVRAEVMDGPGATRKIYDTNTTYWQTLSGNKRCLRQGAHNYYWEEGLNCNKPKLAPLTRGATVAIYSPSARRALNLDTPRRDAHPTYYSAPLPHMGKLKFEDFGELQHIKVVDAGHGLVGLYAVKHGYFIGLHNGIVTKVARGDAMASDWGDERFLPVDAGNGNIGFYNPASHRFLALRSDGAVLLGHQAMAPFVDESSSVELFKVVYK